MEVYVLNTNFETTAMVDAFTSLIWTDRYYKAGDFELYLPTSTYNLSLFKPGYYLWDKDSEHMMIIEDIKTTSDVEYGNNMTVTGRSLESILERRIVWDTTKINTSLQSGIQRLLNDNIINPSDDNRKISNFIFSSSTDPAVTTLALEAQYDGENIYEIITELCEDNEIGFKITLNSNNKFVFKLYAGVDRSYEQNTNPYVVFSPNFENIINSEYTENRSSYKNVCLVVGSEETEDDVTTPAKRVAAGKTSSSGLNRREMYHQESNLKPDNTNAEYRSKGKEVLKDYKIKKTFEGEVETSRIFVYKRDYFLGDILELEDEYGRKSQTRVTEFIRNQDDSGYKAYPSFEVVGEDD